MFQIYIDEIIWFSSILEKSLDDVSIVKHDGKLYIDVFDATGQMLKKPGIARKFGSFYIG